MVKEDKARGTKKIKYPENWQLAQNEGLAFPKKKPAQLTAAQKTPNNHLLEETRSQFVDAWNKREPIKSIYAQAVGESFENGIEGPIRI
ncbi:hypothetical protein DSO57_1037034 [Entomophthora muscae]|uniref:Uncharacterized protein n=1 Tax=Entomophthora muscae TaxID=34485 RepID=A0ACC2RDR8_9FUNG|nr:hypothetical protein DSO57_1037034 [Entomophthora muscae]